ncbi:transporter substrate-binding domain-containing protein [Agrilactobacillus fermenti]|uniref:transporter substrate-binding domain-containing protein n=1 Tax=Agrilactobacillus fermenti TaxID=2586909 RepID=UPI001E5BED5E|nr:transporter substrate-binding domain-containing protein [Agrilactobacillus fermenti]MCD2256274.1 transporter substrate-binding domain-containing protein [Agrilactobacillus fermenti]
MKKFSKVLGLLTASLGLALILGACGNQQAGGKTDSVSSELKTKGELTIGLEGTFAPYSYRDNGKLTGFEVDLGKAVAKKLDLKAKFVPTKWDSLIAGLGSKKFDAVLNNITVTPARQKQYIFSTPYIYSRTFLITKSDNTTIKSVNDLKNRKVAVGTGTENETNAQKYGAKIVPSNAFENSLALVRQGRAEATLNSREAFLAYSKENGSKGLKHQLVPEDKIPAAKVSIMYNKQSKTLQKKVNTALKQLREDGTLKKLSVKYFGADITK